MLPDPVVNPPAPTTVLGAPEPAADPAKVAADAAAAAAAAAKEPPAGETAEAKAAREAKEAADAKAAKDKLPPEKYDFKLPEGVTPDDAKLKAFDPIARELGLSQANAQKLVDFYAQAQIEAGKAGQEQFDTVTAAWKKEAESDKEFGGAKFAENAALANKALKAFGSPKLSEYLVASGAGNHPEVIRFFFKVASAIGEDKLIVGGSNNEPAKDAALKLYPSMTNP